MDQIDLVQVRDRWLTSAKVVINYCVQYYEGKFFTKGATVRFSRGNLLDGIRKQVCK